MLRKIFPVLSFTMRPSALAVDRSRRNDIAWDDVISCEMISFYRPHARACATAARRIALNAHGRRLAGTMAFRPRTEVLRTPADAGSATVSLHLVLFGTALACAALIGFATHRLADGELGMLATLAGFVLGVLDWATTGSRHADMDLLPVASAWTRWPAAAPWLLLALMLWALLCAHTFGRLARSRPVQSLRQRALTPRLPPLGLGSGHGSGEPADVCHAGRLVLYQLSAPQCPAPARRAGVALPAPAVC